MNRVFYIINAWCIYVSEWFKCCLYVSFYFYNFVMNFYLNWLLVKKYFIKVKCGVIFRRRRRESGDFF